MKRQLYVIRGTGLKLDGSVVEVVGEQGDYAVVSPPNLKENLYADGTNNTLVKKACLQPLGDKTVTYSITITKRVGSDPVSNPLMLDIDRCPRDVSLETIGDYIITNLAPILRME